MSGRPRGAAPRRRGPPGQVLEQGAQVQVRGQMPQRERPHVLARQAQQRQQPLLARRLAVKAARARAAAGG